MSQTANIDYRADCDPLLEMATPHIYRRNLFRVLQLPVNATSKDVQRQQTRRRMQEKLGKAASSNGHGAIFALAPAPTEEDARAAVERLNRPMERLLDEVFWFWPTNGTAAGDPALKALEQGQVEKAAEIWMEQVTSDGQGQTAIHNLAVLDHLVALDYEERLASQSLDKKEQELLAGLWLGAFARWKELLDGEEFWSVVKDRVRDLNDLQLTTGFVRRVRGTLPTALLLISAKIAYGAAERSDAALAQRHIRLLRESRFDEGLVDDAIRESIKPVRNRIKTATENAKSRWTTTPQRGNCFVRELHEQAKGLLAVVDAVLPADDLTRAGLHNTVAEAMLEGQIAYGNKTNNWAECIEVLKLAEELASGDTVRSSLAENITILKKNVEAANDWCSPGYWELPEETIASLEAARALTRAGNHEGAIRAVIGLDPTIGKPLRRCLAFCLSQRGSQIFGQGFDEYGKPTSKIQEFLDVIHRRGTLDAPTPQTPSYARPACPCCGSRYYDSWSKGEYKGQRFWMCSSCSAADDRERAEKKRVLCGGVGESLQYLLLADEVDPGDPGILDNLKSLRKIAADISCGIPSTAALRKKLGGQEKKSVGKRHQFEPLPEDNVCYFCGESTVDESCQITVPMCGDAQSVRLLFGAGTQYRYGNVVVPRCRRCRDEHRDSPGRIRSWHEARLAAADNKHFPELAARVKAAADVARPLAARVAEEKRKAIAAQAALARAKYAGNRCETCRSAGSWHQNLCRTCDKDVFQLSLNVKCLVVATVILALTVMVPLGTSVGAPVIAIVPIPFLLGIALYDQLKRLQSRRRRQRSATRSHEIEALRNSVPSWLAVLNGANSAIEATLPSVQAYKSAKKKLDAAKQQATAQFERSHPIPNLLAGVKPEETYLACNRIRKLRKQGWGFGNKPQGDGTTVVGRPVNVDGLVAREVPIVAAVVEEDPIIAAVVEEDLIVAAVAEEEVASATAVEDGVPIATGTLSAEDARAWGFKYLRDPKVRRMAFVAVGAAIAVGFWWNIGKTSKPRQSSNLHATLPQASGSSTPDPPPTAPDDTTHTQPPTNTLAIHPTIAAPSHQDHTPRSPVEHGDHSEEASTANLRLWDWLNRRGKFGQSFDFLRSSESDLPNVTVALAKPLDIGEVTREFGEPREKQEGPIKPSHYFSILTHPTTMKPLELKEPSVWTYEWSKSIKGAGGTRLNLKESFSWIYERVNLLVDNGRVVGAARLERAESPSSQATTDFAVPTQPKTASRTWRTAAGKQIGMAEFVDLKDGNVRLRVNSSQMIAVPIKNLSAADQEFVQKQSGPATMPSTIGMAPSSNPTNRSFKADKAMRSWSDATGTLSVEAEFVDFKDGNVLLRKKNGKTIAVPIEKLSAADQEFVQKQSEPATMPGTSGMAPSSNPTNGSFKAGKALRTWTDATGKHAVEAEFVDFKDGNVQLRKKNGTTITVPIKKLSAADQEFVEKQSK